MAPAVVVATYSHGPPDRFGQRWPKWCARGRADVTSASAAAWRASGPSDVELRDEQVHVAVVALELAAREQQRLAADDRAVLLVDLRRDDQVRLAVLVLEQHEDDAVRGRRPLARDRHARDLQLRAVRRVEASSAVVATPGGQVRAQQLERMHADRERRVPVVGEHLLPRRLRGQLGDLGRRLERQRELAVAAADRLAARGHAEPPEQLPPRPPLVAGARGDERLERVLLHRRAPREIADVGVRLRGRDRLARPPRRPSWT